jgi:hypothetical protein
MKTFLVFTVVVRETLTYGVKNGWTILKWILREIGWDGRDWIELAQDRDQWRALVNTVMNLRVP